MTSRSGADDYIAQALPPARARASAPCCDAHQPAAPAAPGRHRGPARARTDKGGREPASRQSVLPPLLFASKAGIVTRDMMRAEALWEVRRLRWRRTPLGLHSAPARQDRGRPANHQAHPAPSAAWATARSNAMPDPRFIALLGIGAAALLKACCAGHYGCKAGPTAASWGQSSRAAPPTTRSSSRLQPPCASCAMYSSPGRTDRCRSLASRQVSSGHGRGAGLPSVISSTRP